jgi:hypothetical protein
MSVTLTVTADDGSTKQLVLADPVVNSATPANFRNVSSVPYAARTNTTVNKPSGTVDKDVMFAEVFVFSGQGATVALTAPTGWVQIGSPVIVTDVAGYSAAFYLFWKRASSEGSSYVFAHAAASTEIVISSWSGCIETGSPIGATSSNSGQGTSTSAPSITTTAANSRAILAQHGWDAGTFTPPAGMTKRFEDLVFLADYLVASAGPTGAKTSTVPEGPWVARLVELKSKSTVVAPTAPNIGNASFSLQLPVSSGAAVGSIANTGGSVTSWSITGGNASGYFAIDTAGNITVTAAGASGLTAQTYSLTVQATNSVGSSAAATSVAVLAPPSSSSFDISLIPLSKSDPRFANNTPGPTGPALVGGTLTNKTWDKSPGYPDGDAVFAWRPAATPATLSIIKSLMDAREGPRIGGGATTTGAVIKLDQDFINVVGMGDDHPDGLQFFANQGSDGRATCIITNSCIWSYTDAQAVAKYGSAFKGSDCIQYADGFGGRLDVINSALVSGQGFTINIGADDGSTIEVNFDHVYVVGNSGLLFAQKGSGVCTIKTWNEVRNATIVNGVLVPGSLISKPTVRQL